MNCEIRSLNSVNFRCAQRNHQETLILIVSMISPTCFYIGVDKYVDERNVNEKI